MRFALLLSVAVGLAAAAEPLADWPVYGGNPGGWRYSAARQIDRSNVENLEVAWTYHTGDFGDGFETRYKMAFEATPVLADGALYFSTPYNTIIAVDAIGGEERWRFDVGLKHDGYAENTSRGVSSWIDVTAQPDATCRHRIFAGTLDGRLFALDGATGEPCGGFGHRGVIDLTRDVRLRDRGDYTVTSPPAILRDRVIVGSAIGDNRAVELEFGIVRAFDARTGNLLWSWDPIPRNADDPYYREWGSEAAARTGAANAWAVLSVDTDRDLVFVPTSAPSTDFYGGERPGDNHYANSLVALNGTTGEVVWHQQLVHHDVWDYDLPAQPLLVELERDGKEIPAVVQTTKMGLVFTFHRETGQPLFDIEERPVPQDGVDGEILSPTQPFPVAPPPLVSHAAVKPDDAWGMTFWDRGKCRYYIRRYRSEGIYTPPSVNGTILNPGYAGGSNWGGLSWDPERRWVIANTMTLPMVVRLIPKEKLQALRESGKIEGGYSEQEGTPYVMQRHALLSPWEIPCVEPPWGKLTAIDMDDGSIRWEIPLGTTRDLAPRPFIFNWGVPNVGGSIVTAGGLIFIAATTDQFLRAFDIETGEELWKHRLPAGGQASPMTFVSEENGKQYVVIAAGGHGNMGTKLGDTVIAFTLPDS